MPRSLPIFALGFASAMLAVSGAPAWAEDRAVVVGNSSYANLPDVADIDTAAAVSRFKQRGFRVVEGSDLRAADLRTALGDLVRPDNAPGDRIVVLKGRFVHSRNETWFLGQDAGAQGIMTAGLTGVPLSLVTDLMSDGSRKSVLLLGTDSSSFDAGPGLLPGLGDKVFAPGVAVIHGYTDGIGRAAEVLARAGGTVDEALKQGGSLRLMPGAGSGGSNPVVVPAPGTQPVVVPGQPVVVPPAPPVVVPAPAPDKIVQPNSAEQEVWNRAKRSNSVAGYREFLNKYPSSIFAGAARGRIQDLQPVVAPQVSGPEATESALNLSRSQRINIQHNLTLLNYDTKGADGAFGPATRRAISRFQADGGVAVTGYLNRSQLDLLNRSAAERSRQLQNDAKKKKEAEAEDNRYWNQQLQNGAVGAERYLARYPNGLHADKARKVMADAARGVDRETSDQAWERAKSVNTVEAYRNFLNNNPRSRYADEARRRIANASETTARGEADEAALGLTLQLRQMIEQRLGAMGFNPGKVDGRFDNQTRRALRQYQASRGLPSTGYVNQATAGRLLADSLGR